MHFLHHLYFSNCSQSISYSNSFSSSLQVLFFVAFPCEIVSFRYGFVACLCGFKSGVPKLYPNLSFKQIFHRAIISYTLCSQFIFVFAFAYPIPHSIQQKQIADTEHLSPPRFLENRPTYLRNQPPSISADYDTVVAFAAIVPVSVTG